MRVLGRYFHTQTKYDRASRCSTLHISMISICYTFMACSPASMSMILDRGYMHLSALIVPS